MCGSDFNPGRTLRDQTGRSEIVVGYKWHEDCALAELLIWKGTIVSLGLATRRLNHFVAFNLRQVIVYLDLVVAKARLYSHRCKGQLKPYGGHQAKYPSAALPMLMILMKPEGRTRCTKQHHRPATPQLHFEYQ